MNASERALDFVRDGQIVGLGTGRAANAFVEALARRKLKIRGVPTSQATEKLAKQLGIPLLTLEEAGALDVTVDGADEVDPNLNLIKGWGGALVREKIVAASSKKLVILVGPEKMVPALGTRGKLPVEVVPFAKPLCVRRLREMSLTPTERVENGKPYVTDNGNLILDCAVKPIADPGELDRSIRAIPGVVGTGLFVGMADVVLVQRSDLVETLERKR